VQEIGGVVIVFAPGLMLERLDAGGQGTAYSLLECAQ
jgi:hypothetical protein